MPATLFRELLTLLLVAAAAAAAAVTTTTAAVTTATTTVATAASVTTAASTASGRALFVEAVAAVDRAVTTRLERHLGGLATLAARDVEQLALRTGSAVEATATAGVATVAVHAALRAAVAAALGLAKAARCIELLVVRGKREPLVAVHAR